jgi:hypothetical protein
MASAPVAFFRAWKLRRRMLLLPVPWELIRSRIVSQSATPAEPTATSMRVTEVGACFSVASWPGHAELPT